VAKALVNGINVHYWQVGDGPPLVLIHGLTGNLAVWHFTLVPRLRQDFTMLTYDLRGHGRSDMSAAGYTTGHMADDLLGLMDYLGIDKAHLLGHSLGADIALQLAMEHPDRVGKIVAIEAGLAALVDLRKDPDWPGWADWAHALEHYAGIQAPKEKWNDLRYMLLESLKAPIYFGPGRGLPRKGEKLLKLLDTTTLLDDYEDSSGLTVESISTIHNPVLLIYGGASGYLDTYEVLRNGLPDVRTVLLENCAHFGALERPDEVVAAVRPFLVGDESTEGGGVDA
jgi:pimeloyl-ACP methyl ester carboxylesterase